MICKGIGNKSSDGCRWFLLILSTLSDVHLSDSSQIIFIAKFLWLNENFHVLTAAIDVVCTFFFVPFCGCVWCCVLGHLYVGAECDLSTMFDILKKSWKVLSPTSSNKTIIILVIIVVLSCMPLTCCYCYYNKIVFCLRVKMLQTFCQCFYYSVANCCDFFFYSI